MKRFKNQRRTHRCTIIFSCCLAVLAGALSGRAADNSSAKSDASLATNTVVKAEKPAPLPLHQIEGNGGVFSTLSAYLVNPPRDGEPVGRPSIGFAYVNIGSGRNLEALTVTETPWNRLELGYAYDNFGMGDLPKAIKDKTGLDVQQTSIAMHNVNARLQLLKEGEFNQKWIPALTFGVHYKYNDDIKDIDQALNGTLHGLGITHHDGVDFTLYASKLFTCMPRPVLVNLGGRATKSAQIGLLGFTDDYSFVFEGSVVVFATDRLLLAAEYKQKPNAFHSMPPLVGPEDDWWTIDVGYVVSKNMTIAAGYGHFGRVVNHEANGVWGITTKWEF
jgi:hypothetical protein